MTPFAIVENFNIFKDLLPSDGSILVDLFSNYEKSFLPLHYEHYMDEHYMDTHLSVLCDMECCEEGHRSGGNGTLRVRRLGLISSTANK
jgi:hypothetical protein